MILTGLQIAKEVKNNRIFISEFKKANINPNSYDLTLSDELAVYQYSSLDMRQETPTYKFNIDPDKGYELQPGELYLAKTNEITFTEHYVPMLEGRSSIGRLGLFIHVTAGFGDIGFNGYWTLEMTVIRPLRIYPNIRIGQIFFHKPYGAIKLYEGKYQNNRGIQASKLYKDFK